jgi:hypothetical protein
MNYNLQTTVVAGNAMYSYRSGSPMLDAVMINGIEVQGNIYKLLEQNMKVSAVNHFSRFPYKIEFGNEIKQICTEMFESIKHLKKNANEELAGKAASHLFGAFAGYWDKKAISGNRVLA